MFFCPDFDRTFFKKSVENLIRRCVLRRLSWVCTVCLCPTKRTPGLYVLSFVTNDTMLNLVVWDLHLWWCGHGGML